MDLTQTQAELSRLTQLEGRPIPTADPQILINKTAIERLDLVITYHKTKIEEIEARINKLEDRLVDTLPIKKKSLWERIIK